jgi:hypothetical protein
MNHEGALARATVETHQLGFDWGNLDSEATEGNIRRGPLILLRAKRPAMTTGVIISRLGCRCPPSLRSIP